MKPLNILALVFIVSILIMTMASAQDIEPGTWHVSVSRETIYIGETYFVNVSGMANHSFEMRYICASNPNNTFWEYLETNDVGVANFNTPKRFEEGEEGFYRIALFVMGIEADRVTIEVVYDEIKALVMRIEDLENKVRQQDAADARHDQNDATFERKYKTKWLPFVILVFCWSFGWTMWHIWAWWPYYKYRYEKWNEKGHGDYLNKALALISAGRVEDHRDEYAGFPPKSEPQPFTEDDIDPEGKWPRPDMVGKTMEEVMEIPAAKEKKGA